MSSISQVVMAEQLTTATRQKEVGDLLGLSYVSESDVLFVRIDTKQRLKFGDPVIAAAVTEAATIAVNFNKARYKVLYWSCGPYLLLETARVLATFKGRQIILETVMSADEGALTALSGFEGKRLDIPFGKEIRHIQELAPFVWKNGQHSVTPLVEDLRRH